MSNELSQVNPTPLPPLEQARRKLREADAALEEAEQVVEWQNDLCRYCSKPVSDADAGVTHSYWKGMKFLCHKNCKAAGEKAEALECQTLDADCNDCRHYKRGTSAPKQISRYKNHKGEWVEIIYKPELWIGGHCLKFDRIWKAESGQCGR